jgi:UDP-N-acetylmuramoyl-tripeptide--D-alanyl-D-alanine ligase
LYADTAGSAAGFCAIRPGDAIVIKRSPDSKMKTIVNALEKRFPGSTAQDQAAV